ncbi:MAG: hypothetical protein WKG07_04805 [Hymenobacter sp.]
MAALLDKVNRDPQQQAAEPGAGRLRAGPGRARAAAGASLPDELAGLRPGARSTRPCRRPWRSWARRRWPISGALDQEIRARQQAIEAAVQAQDRPRADRAGGGRHRGRASVPAASGGICGLRAQVGALAEPPDKDGFPTATCAQNAGRATSGASGKVKNSRPGAAH